MDPITHALSGALVGRATVPRVPDASRLTVQARIVTCAVAAAWPDVDIVVQHLSPVAYLRHHRGLTHSILLWPLWAWLLAFAASRLARDPRGVRPWLSACALGVALHIAGDLITSYGTLILAPLSDRRFALGTTFIIDPWLSGIILAGLAGSLVMPRSRVPAVLATVVIVGYLGLQAVAKSHAHRLGKQHAREAKLDDARIDVHPRPVTPFNWTVFVSTSERIDYAHVNTVRREPKPEPAPGAGFIARLNAPYRPLDQAQWQTRARFGDTPSERALVQAAWQAPALAVFRWFADVPAYDGMSPGVGCVWFRDLRFLTPGTDRSPFRYGVCRGAADRAWRLHLSEGGEALPVPVGAER
ncbi:MAG TPA: metal-dependent hydrolase [Casimicrobiaceae bacterium]|nr:metal-dependent hydrolase [Casimicrobiaceae bacterium]